MYWEEEKVHLVTPKLLNEAGRKEKETLLTDKFIQSTMNLERVMRNIMILTVFRKIQA